MGEHVSLFQEMDIGQYVKTLQGRISSGLVRVLRAEGDETGGFERYVINVSGAAFSLGR
ncbi:hypothetical protein [Streptomyces sp. NPDC004296]|uniref:hypothetical protein n=1 Tax=Streptomyces sp. NPDC004296 TaxID=3364697 RepID=UPI0036AB265E